MSLNSTIFIYYYLQFLFEEKAFYFFFKCRNNFLKNPTEYELNYPQ